MKSLIMYLVLAGLFMPQVKDLNEVTEDNLLNALVTGKTSINLYKHGRRSVFFNCKTAEYAFMDSIVSCMDKSLEMFENMAELIKSCPDYGYGFSLSYILEDNGIQYLYNSKYPMNITDKGNYHIHISWVDSYQPSDFWFKYKGYQFYSNNYLKSFFTEIDGFFMQINGLNIPDFDSANRIDWRFVVTEGRLTEGVCSVSNSNNELENTSYDFFDKKVNCMENERS